MTQLKDSIKLVKITHYSVNKYKKHNIIFYFKIKNDTMQDYFFVKGM